MLTSIDIHNSLKKYRWFGGVYSIDRLPHLITKPKAFVINLDESYKEGSHWVAVNFNNYGRALYFDSFGREPEGLILTFIERNAPNGYSHSSMKYQGNDSTACGYFCVLFVILANRLRKFFSLFRICKHSMNEKILKNILIKICNEENE